ncbi:MAG: endolytic transglycosylase MltG, partial [Gammaproteobacteria bacterium]|nr:endolytic transglycosylase MltG [Gammaproteobacteria bacterium]
AMQEALETAWNARAQGLPLESPYELLTLASIIEKETTVGHERAMIAAVFTTRLNRGMRLQADPTVIYGMGEEYQGNIRRKDLKADTPYNTYLHKGLPPTPIALPGRASIAAALNPADSEMVYFVAKRDGTHHFSATYKEHRKAVIRYQLKGCKNCYGSNGGN